MRRISGGKAVPHAPKLKPFVLRESHGYQNNAANIGVQGHAAPMQSAEGTICTMDDSLVAKKRRVRKALLRAL